MNELDRVFANRMNSIRRAFVVEMGSRFAESFGETETETEREGTETNERTRRNFKTDDVEWIDDGD